MQSGTAIQRYSGMAITLHWLIAAMIGINLVLVWFADDWPKDWVRPAIDLHKSFGITVVGLALLRILWRIGHPPPPLPAAYPPIERVGSTLAHLALYGLMLAIPISGWLHDSAWKDAPTHPIRLFWLVPFPRLAMIAHAEAVHKEHLHDLFYAAHKYLAYVLYGVFALHVGGALKHQWIDKEPELQRMLPGTR